MKIQLIRKFKKKELDIELSKFRYYKIFFYDLIYTKSERDDSSALNTYPSSLNS
jgi:hypothetical protein